MDFLKAYSTLLPTIYDSAITADFWGNALDQCATLVDSKSATLLIVEMNDADPYAVSAASSVFIPDNNETLLSDYVSRYAHHEQAVCDFLMQRNAQHIYEDSEIYPNYGEVRTRPDYRYIEEHFGLYRRTVSRLNGNMHWYDLVSFQFDSTLEHIPAGHKDKVALLLPHLAKAAEMSRVFQQLRTRYEAVLGALNHVQAGMAICTSNGTVLLKNDAADAIIQDSDGIGTSGQQKITTQNLATTQELLAAIENASNTASGSDNQAEHLLSIGRQSLKRPYLVEVSPLKDSAGEVERHLEAALVTIIDPTVEYNYSVEKLAIAYGLTQAEGQVCALLLSGSSVSDIADIRNVQPETVKDQIASIRAKTGSANRYELIRIATKTAPLLTRRD